MKTQLPSWTGSRFNVRPNVELLAQLNQELAESPMSFHKPASCWMLPEELSNGSMGDLMAPWCGRVGQIPLANLDEVVNVSGSADLIPNYERFLRSIDHCGLLNGISLRDLGERQWRVMDLGSLMDFLLLSAFSDFSSGQDRFKIIEVGGGFGRLIEFLVLATDAKIKYVNVDAVPVSLMYSYQYLSQAFPEKTVRILAGYASVDDDCDFLVVPAWHLHKLAGSSFDMGVNIESMQEMNQELVDHYLNFFDRSVKGGGLIYLVNAREYKFKGDWNIPENWQCLLRHRTPRSWTANHPTDIFRKASVSQHAQNTLRAAFFGHELQSLTSGKLW